ncbi:NACHT domain-containing protein [Streptomyces sp. NPDC056452]|uniref:NACHT domain-containing protein n=1 Tax=Streptomyces sp. NPDC056452 TaxID=3345821 RepID=UPI0036A7B1D7
MSVQGNGPRQRWESASLGAGIISAAISIISVLFNRTDSYLLPVMLVGVLAAGITVWLSSYRSSGFLSRYLRYVMELSAPLGSGGPTGAHVFGPAVSLPGDTFVDVDLTEDGLPGRHPLTRYLRSAKPVVLLLVGAPGTGKTTLLRQTALTAVAGRLKSPRRTPVLLRLGALATDVAQAPELSLGDVAHSSLGELRSKVGAGWFERRLRNGRCLVLLDGLDEVPDPDRRRAVSAWIEAQTARYPRNDFLITSRPFPEARQLLPAARMLTLQPLTDQQVAQFVKRWLSNNPASLRHPSTRGAVPGTGVLLDRLRDRSDLFELASNPMLLSLLMSSFRLTGQLPGNRTALYGEVFKQALSRHRSPAEDFPDLSPSRKERVVRVLALAMLQQGTEYASEAECSRMIEKTLRRSGAVNTKRFLEVMVEDGILVRRDGRAYAFFHRAFQDFLAAQQIAAQGSFRLLVEHMESPRWRDVILTWASSSDASPVIEACLARGTRHALALAVACADVSPQIEPGLRSMLARVRTSRQTAGATADALTEFVEKAYSAPAAELLLRAHDEHRPVSHDDIEGLPARRDLRPAHEWSESDATAFLSAAVLAGELADHDEARGYRFKGLIALSYALRDQSPASSRDLCLSALRQLDPDEPHAADVRLACLAYFGDVADPQDEEECFRALRASCRTAGATACELMIPLVAAHRKAAQLVVGALRADEELARRIADGLGTDRAGATTTAGWDAAVEKWRRARRELVHQFCDLAHLVLVKDEILHARELVADRLREEPPPVLELEGLDRALDRLDHSLRRSQFGERDAALRAAARHAKAMRAAVRSTPTGLSVELSEPAAARIEDLVRSERRRLVREHPPRPRLSAALPFARLRNGVVTVPVEVANDGEHSAPIEAASLTTGDPAPPGAPGSGRIEVPSPVRGGTATTVLLRLVPTPIAQGTSEIETEVTLTYRPRHSSRDATCTERLRVTLATEYVAVDPNPFTEGGMGRPVHDPAMLFGREELIEKVRAALGAASAPGAGIALFGQKRTGKSSIGVELMRRLGTFDGLPVVDVGNLGELTPQRKADEDQSTLLGTLLWRILEGADATITEGPRLLPVGFDRKSLIESPDPVLDCNSLFTRYRAARPGSPPWVVFIDEFQYMDQWIRDELVHPSFLRTFKAIVERSLFHLVLVGQVHLERLVEEDPNAFGVFGLERVTCLAEADARALIQQPVQLGTPSGPVSRYHERAVEEIIRLTGGNPFYIQKICYALIEHMNKERTDMITDADVREVTGQLLDTLRAGDFDGLESPDAGDPRWDAAELRAALVAVAWACRDKPAAHKAILRCHEGPLPVELLDHLVSREVVRRVGDGYQFVVGLYEEWLRRYFAAPEGRL